MIDVVFKTKLLSNGALEYILYFIVKARNTDAGIQFVEFLKRFNSRKYINVANISKATKNNYPILGIF